MRGNPLLQAHATGLAYITLYATLAIVTDEFLGDARVTQFQPPKSFDQLLAQSKGLKLPQWQSAPLPQQLAAPGEASQNGTLISQKMALLANHMSQQQYQHQHAVANCNRLFAHLLDDLPAFVEAFQAAFATKNIGGEQIYCQIDPDRSVGILRVLWHTLSFTTRGNSQPLALARHGRDPVFTGRILCVRGDFQDLSLLWDPQQFSDLLPFEIASLFVPADETQPAIMTVPHLGDTEAYFHQADAARLFLLRTVELVCGGGFLHELS